MPAVSSQPSLYIQVNAVHFVAAAKMNRKDSLKFEPCAGGGVDIVVPDYDGLRVTIHDPDGTASRAAEIQMQSAILRAAETEVEAAETPPVWVFIESVFGVEWLNMVRVTCDRGDLIIRHAAEIMPA